MRSKSLLLVALILAGAVAGCTSIGPLPTPVAPTKTPKPTFTATPDWTPTPVTFATDAPVAAEPTVEAAAPAQPEATAGSEATEAPTDETPTAEPPAAGASQVARLTANQTVNVRGGPGTNYPVIGRLSAGQAYPVTGKNARGDWYQFDLDGKSAWVIANLVSVSGDPAAVLVAQNIPAVPTARPTARPQPRPTSPPAAPQPAPQPQPQPAPAAPQYDWMLDAGAVRGAEQCGTVHFDGQVQYKNGTPQNGVCIYLDYYGPRTIKFSGGGGSGDGNWSFSPCGPGDCKGPFEIYVVECPGDVPGAGLTLEGGSPPTPRSNKFTATVSDKCQQGQWTNIIFKNTRE
jgi:uncharacterized protein YraI